MDDKTIYTFKKDYECSLGKISQGRDITSFRGILYIDGIMIPEPYSTDVRRLLENEQFVKEYIKKTNIVKNKV